jgi:hypothetical protein
VLWPCGKATQSLPPRLYQTNNLLGCGQDWMRAEELPKLAVATSFPSFFLFKRIG